MTMASKDYSLVNIQDDDQEIDLQFQDFGSTSTKPYRNERNPGQAVYFADYTGSQDDDQERLLDEETDTQTSKPPGYSFWTFEYYQQFFNVDSKQVGDRIIWSMVPKPGVNYLQSYIRPNPDLYGPFWICVTLVFTTAVTGNLANYLQTPVSYKWKYDFHKVTLATSSIFSYAWLLPIVIWGLLLWRRSKANLSLLELICIYGYSLSVFIPVSLLWMIPLKWLQWCLGIVAAVLSGSVLVRTISPAISHEAKKIAIAVALVILALHAALALGFMLYFFYSPNGALDGKPIELSNQFADTAKNETKISGFSAGRPVTEGNKTKPGGEKQNDNAKVDVEHGNDVEVKEKGVKKRAEEQLQDNKFSQIITEKSDESVVKSDNSKNRLVDPKVPQKTNILSTSADKSKLRKMFSNSTDSNVGLSRNINKLTSGSVLTKPDSDGEKNRNISVKPAAVGLSGNVNEKETSPSTLAELDNERVKKDFVVKRKQSVS